MEIAFLGESSGDAPVNLFDTIHAISDGDESKRENYAAHSEVRRYIRRLRFKFYRCILFQLSKVLMRVSFIAQIIIFRGIWCTCAYVMAIRLYNKRSKWLFRATIRLGRRCGWMWIEMYARKKQICLTFRGIVRHHFATLSAFGRDITIHTGRIGISMRDISATYIQIWISKHNINIRIFSRDLCSSDLMEDIAS